MMSIKKHEILIAIYKYLELQYDLDKNKTNEYIDYCSNINPFRWNDKYTADPAYYDDFTIIFSKYFKMDECSVKEAYDFAKKYLNEYNQIEKEQFGSNIDEVVNVFSKCSFEDWEDIIDNVQSVE